MNLDPELLFVEGPGVVFNTSGAEKFAALHTAARGVSVSSVAGVEVNLEPELLVVEGPGVVACNTSGAERSFAALPTATAGV